MSKNEFHSKERHFTHLSNEVNNLILNNEWETIDPSVKESLIKRLKRLYQELKGFLSPSVLARKLALAAAFVFGVSSSMGQNFKAPVMDTFNFSSANYIEVPRLVDIDNDGDLDLLNGTFDYNYYDTHITYYQNTGGPGSPNFINGINDPFNIVPDTFDLFLSFGDIDSDGDFDMFTNGYYAGTKFYENTGNAIVPSFANGVVNAYGLSTPAYYWAPVAMVDIDNDGDLDIVQWDTYGFLFYENTGTPSSPSFGSAQMNPFNLTATYNSYYSELGQIDFVDIDGDGDQDMFIGDLYGTIHYYQNTGDAANPNFDTPKQNPFNIQPLYYMSFCTFGDLDNDGDIDIISGGYYGHLYFYENLGGIADVKDELTSSIDVYPTISRDFIHVRSSDQIINEIEVFSITGQKLTSTSIKDQQHKLDLQELSAGTYIIHIHSNKGIQKEKIIKK